MLHGSTWGKLAGREARQIEVVKELHQESRGRDKAGLAAAFFHLPEEEDRKESLTLL